MSIKTQSEIENVFIGKAIKQAMISNGSFIAQDDFSFVEIDDENELKKQIDWIKKYNEIRGSTRIYQNKIAMFHYGNGEYGLYKIIDDENIEFFDSLSINLMKSDEIYDSINKIIASLTVNDYYHS